MVRVLRCVRQRWATDKCLFGFRLKARSCVRQASKMAKRSFGCPTLRDGESRMSNSNDNDDNNNHHHHINHNTHNTNDTNTHDNNDSNRIMELMIMIIMMIIMKTMIVHSNHHSSNNVKLVGSAYPAPPRCVVYLNDAWRPACLPSEKREVLLRGIGTPR